MSRTAYTLVLSVACSFALAQTSGCAGAPRRQALQQTLQERFAKADANHDGQLTREEANGNMPFVAKHFEEIDAAGKGYVTIRDIQSFVIAKRGESRQGGGAGPSS